MTQHTSSDAFARAVSAYPGIADEHYASLPGDVTIVYVPKARRVTEETATGTQCSPFVESKIMATGPSGITAIGWLPCETDNFAMITAIAEDVAAAVAGDASDIIAQAADLQRQVESLGAQSARLRDERDGHLRAAAHWGVTKYRLAQSVDLTEAQIGRIVNRAD